MRFLLLLCIVLMPLAARAQELTVFAAASLTDAMKDISALWAQSGHQPLRMSFGSSSTLARQIEQAAPANLLASADQKWMDYRRHCDRLFFATHAAVPCDIFPAEAGLIVADAFGAAIISEAPEERIAAATRKAVTLRFAHAAALRLQAVADPQGPYNAEL